MQVIHLDQDTLNRCYRWAQEVVRVNKITKKIDKSKSELETYLIGKAGECAFSKFLGIEYNFKINGQYGDFGDIFYQNKMYEVKSNKYYDKLLKVPKWQIDKKLDGYILVRQMNEWLQSFYIVGWCWKEEFIENMEEIKFRGYENFPMYYVEDYQLREFKERKI